MWNGWRTVAHGSWGLASVLTACLDSTQLNQPNALDASVAVDAARDAAGDTAGDAPRDAGDGSVAVPIRYVPAPDDGGDCALAEDITLSSSGADGWYGGSVMLIAPSTIAVERYDSLQPSGNSTCTFPAPACGTQRLPDFSDVRALLTRPDVVALRNGGGLAFGEYGYPYISKNVRIGSWTVAIHSDPPPGCDELDQDAGGAPCVPGVVGDLFTLIESFANVHTCR